MERAGYRETLGFLMELYPGKAGISVKEAASALGVHETTIYDSMKTQRIEPLPHKKVGGKVVIPIPALARWMCVART
jgi:excisionase family DNA binding protein